MQSQVFDQKGSENALLRLEFSRFNKAVKKGVFLLGLEIGADTNRRNRPHWPWEEGGKGSKIEIFPPSRRGRGLTARARLHRDA